MSEEITQAYKDGISYNELLKQLNIRVTQLSVYPDVDDLIEAEVKYKQAKEYT